MASQTYSKTARSSCPPCSSRLSSRYFMQSFYTHFQHSLAHFSTDSPLFPSIFIRSTRILPSFPFISPSFFTHTSRRHDKTRCYYMGPSRPTSDEAASFQSKVVLHGSLPTHLLWHPLRPGVPAGREPHCSTIPLLPYLGLLPHPIGSYPMEPL